MAGTPVSPGPSASRIIIGGTTSALSPPPAIAPASTPVININSQAVQSNAAGQYVANGQTLSPGSQITVSGQAISLDLSGNAAVYGLGTQAITPQTALAVADLLALTVGAQAISLAPSASQFVIGTRTIPLIPTPKSAKTTPSPRTIAGQTITANSASTYVTPGQTLTPGGSAITVSGTRISLAPYVLQVVMGTSSFKFGSSGSGGASTTSGGGLGGLVMNGFASTASTMSNGGNGEFMGAGIIQPGKAGATGKLGIRAWRA